MDARIKSEHDEDPCEDRIMLQRFGETLPEREVKFAPCDLKRVEADGTFAGYASLFGEVDLGQDLVMPGAFRDSLRLRGPQGVKLLFQHDPNEPIGVWLELYEDTKGLFARGRLMPEVVRAREVLSLMRAGALDGLSIGFRTVKGRTDPKSGVRRLDTIDLWEISIVTFPMLPEARVSTVKRRGVLGALPTQRPLLPNSAAAHACCARDSLRAHMDAVAASWEAGARCRRLIWLLHARAVVAKHTQLAEAFKGGFSPNQPRVPAGNPDGGQWTGSGGGGGGSQAGRDASDRPADTPEQRPEFCRDSEMPSSRRSQNGW